MTGYSIWYLLEELTHALLGDTLMDPIALSILADEHGGERPGDYDF